jgi:hypothetical protein
MMVRALCWQPQAYRLGFTWGPSASDLHNQGVAHLAVRVRDGTGLVGPLVVPGVTSCLGSH